MQPSGIIDTEFVPYENKVHRTLAARAARARLRGPSVQQELNAQAFNAMKNIPPDHGQFFNFADNRLGTYNDFSIFGEHVPGTSCPEDDPAYMDSITADSTPEYAASATEILIGTALGGVGGILSASQCAWDYTHWMQWYKVLAAANGADQAAATWGGAFDKTSMHEWGFYKEEQEFRDFCATNNLVAKSIILQAQAKAIQTKQDASAAAESVLKSAEKVATNTGKTLADTTGALDKLIKWTPWIIAGVLLVAVAAYIYISVVNKKIATI